MSLNLHGATEIPGRQHPVLDIRDWETEFPLKDDDREEGGWIEHPGELARREQALRRAKGRGDLGPCVPADVFVWADTQLRDLPWLTRIGGTPWRPKDKPWPRDSNGVPLAFLGQICFADSVDILPCKLPGDVALLFGTHSRGYVSITDGSSLEWSPLKIEKPEDGFGVPWTVELPYAYQGVIHRTVQYTDWKAAEPAFKSLGYKEGGWGLYSIQATSIGAYARLPQGWPFDEGESLIATLSSFYFRGKWPLCDIPDSLQKAYRDGRRDNILSNNAHDFGIGDAGCIWIYRDKAGNFRLDDACG